jgi:hypothetical protein
MKPITCFWNYVIYRLKNEQYIVFSDLWKIFFRILTGLPHLDGSSSRKQHQYRRIAAWVFFILFNPKILNSNKSTCQINFSKNSSFRYVRRHGVTNGHTTCIGNSMNTLASSPMLSTCGVDVSWSSNHAILSGTSNRQVTPFFFWLDHKLSQTHLPCLIN